MDSTKAISNLSEAKALKLVFGLLCTQDLKQCALVSKRWRDQIDTEIGFKVIVGKNRHNHLSADQVIVDWGLTINDSRNHPIQLITQIGIQSCHKATLKKLSVVIHLDKFSDPVNSKLDNKCLFTELVRLSKGLTDLQLQSMFVQITSVKNSRTQFMLRHILDSQKHNQLKHVFWIFIGKSVIYGFPNELVTRNHNSLESIEMDIGPLCQESINCDVFANCASLSYLTLTRGRALLDPGDWENRVPDGPPLTQTQLLPASLVSIRICGLQVGNEDARLISIRNLDVLELKNIGNSNGFGLPFSAFQNIIASQNIKLSWLQNCLNKEEGFVGGGAATVVFDKIFSGVSEPVDHQMGLILQLIDQQYSIMRVNPPNSASLSYYDYGTDPRSTYFKNLKLQLPICMDEFEGPIKLDLIPCPIPDDINDDFNEDVEEDEFAVVEEDLSDADGDVNLEEPNSDGGEEEGASDFEADDNDNANALVTEDLSYLNGGPSLEEEISDGGEEEDA